MHAVKGRRDRHNFAAENPAARLESRRGEKISIITVGCAGNG